MYRLDDPINSSPKAKKLGNVSKGRRGGGKAVCHSFGCSKMEMHERSETKTGRDGEG